MLSYSVCDCYFLTHNRYDGQIFVKPPEILTRDRLLSIYQVKPVLAKLRQTLIASAGALVFSTLVLAGVVQFNGPLDSGKIRKPREVTTDGIIFSERVKSLSQVCSVHCVSYQCMHNGTTACGG